jgi:hypothetical protein
MPSKLYSRGVKKKLTHTTTLSIPNDCTGEQFEELLNNAGISFEQTKYKEERIEKDLIKIRGKTVMIISDNEHVVQSYIYNLQLERENIE